MWSYVDAEKIIYRIFFPSTDQNTGSVHALLLISETERTESIRNSEGSGATFARFSICLSLPNTCYVQKTEFCPNTTLRV